MLDDDKPDNEEIDGACYEELFKACYLAMEASKGKFSEGWEIVPNRASPKIDR